MQNPKKVQRLKIIDEAKIYILIHGAWHGSWCWYKIIPLLRKLGHKVIAPNLASLFNDEKNFREISLKSYTDYIENLINDIPRKVILVGHSMAGIIITQMGENIPEKIEKLIYIAGLIPENNSSLIEEERKSLFPTISLETKIDKLNNSIFLSHNSDEKICNLLYNNSSEKDKKYALSMLKSQAFQPFLDKISYSDTRFGALPKVYIETLQDNSISIQDQRRIHSKINCEVKIIDTDHSPFFSSPKMLIQLIT